MLQREDVERIVENVLRDLSVTVETIGSEQHIILRLKDNIISLTPIPKYNNN